MDKSVNMSNLIGIGELSQMYDISKRTLRIYHDMGLFVPEYVDQQTGYRYYSPAQFPRLEMIMQMKAVGLPLKNILTMLNTKDISMFEALLNKRIDELDEQIAEYTASRNSLIKQLDSCKYLRNPPPLDEPFIEFIPRRRALVFDIEPYDLLGTYPETSPWETAVEKIRGKFQKNGMPLSYLQSVGCMVAGEALRQEQYICSGAFILLNESDPLLPEAATFQSGTYLCAYRKYIAMDNKYESDGIRKRLEYIRANEYTIEGPYLGELMAKTAVFDYDDRNILVKQQIPVKITL